MSKAHVIILAVIWLIMATFAVIQDGQDMDLQSRAADSFVPVEAYVYSSRVDSYTRGSGRDRETIYTPDIVYMYEFDGQEFTADRYDYYGKNSGRAHIEGIVAQYPVGTMVQAWVDPQNPQESVLSNTPPDKLASNILGGLFWLSGFGLLVIGLCMKKGSYA